MRKEESSPMAFSTKVQKFIDDPLCGFSTEALQQRVSADAAREALAHEPQPFLLEKFANEEGITLDEARETFEEVKRFLLIGSIIDSSPARACRSTRCGIRSSSSPRTTPNSAPRLVDSSTTGRRRLTRQPPGANGRADGGCLRSPLGAALAAAARRVRHHGLQGRRLNHDGCTERRSGHTQAPSDESLDAVPGRAPDRIRAPEFASTARSRAGCGSPCRTEPRPGLASVAQILALRGVPVVTFLTDLPLGHRLPSATDQETPWRAGWCRFTSAGSGVPYHFDRSLRQSQQWESVPDCELAHASAEVDVVAQHWLRSVAVRHWVNPLDPLLKAENKLTQLARARDAGLLVPRTLLTESPQVAADFAASLPHGAIVKAMSGSGLHRFAPLTPFIYTRALGTPDAESPWAFPRMVQERVRAEHEVRVTVVGRRVFAAGLRRAGTDDDWRHGAAERGFRPITLPIELRSSLLALVDSLELSVAGIDLLEEGGRFHFLEANPSPGFLWLERTIGWSLSEKVADWLCHRT